MSQSPIQPDRLAISQAIAERLEEIHEAQRTPLAIVMGPDIARLFQDDSSGSAGLFYLPIEIDATGRGWEIRTKL